MRLDGIRFTRYTGAIIRAIFYCRGINLLSTGPLLSFIFKVFFFRIYFVNIFNSRE